MEAEEKEENLQNQVEIDGQGKTLQPSDWSLQPMHNWEIFPPLQIRIGNPKQTRRNKKSLQA